MSSLLPSHPAAETFLRQRPRAKQWLCLCVVLLVGASGSVLLSAQEEERDGSYGFNGKRIFKFNRGVGPVIAADLDGDGRHDIAVIDNYRAELVVLRQDPTAQGEVFNKGPNALRNADGFRRKELPLKRKIVGIEAVDLDGDPHLDLVLLSQGVLEVWWGDPDLAYGDKTLVRLRDMIARSNAVAIDRIAKDRVDLYLLGRKGIFVLRQFRRDRAPEQDMLPSSAGNTESLFLCDFDGDRLTDLVTVVDDRDHPYRVRRRLAGDLGFGPELLLAADRPAAVTQIAGPQQARLVALGLGQARFDVLQLDTESSQDPLDLPGPEIYPLDAGGVSGAKLLVDDIDGDGDTDVVVAHNGDSTLRTFINQKGKLTPTVPSPTVRGINSIDVSMLPGDSTPSLLVASSDEKVVGASALVERTVTFPKALKGLPTPLLAVTGCFVDKDTPVLAVVHRDEKDGKTLLELFQHQGDEWKSLAITHTLTSSNEPKDALVTDLNQDGVHELLLFASYSAPEMHRISGAPEEPTWQQVLAPGVFEKSSRGSTALALNGDLLLCAGNHCRRIAMDDKGELVVRYQVNGVSSNSSIAAAVEVRLGNPAQHYLALFDKSDNSMNLFLAEGAQPEFRRSFDGPFATLQQATSADLDGDGSDELLLLDQTSLAVIRTHGQRYTLRSLFTYSNPDEEARYVMASTGDLNADGENDLVLSNGSQRKLQILRADPDKPGREGHWTHALRFEVYEAMSFSARSGGALEPRWIHVTDLTGDGLQDLLILVHDRLILYPQDSNRS